MHHLLMTMQMLLVGWLVLSCTLLQFIAGTHRLREHVVDYAVQ